MSDNDMLKIACQPVVEYLQNFNPHTYIIVTSDGIYQVSTDLYIPGTREE